MQMDKRIPIHTTFIYMLFLSSLIHSDKKRGGYGITSGIVENDQRTGGRDAPGAVAAYLGGSGANGFRIGVFNGIESPSGELGAMEIAVERPCPGEAFGDDRAVSSAGTLHVSPIKIRGMYGERKTPPDGGVFCAQTVKS